MLIWEGRGADSEANVIADKEAVIDIVEEVSDGADQEVGGNI